MQTPTASSSGPRHVVAIAAIAVLSIPGWLTALSPIGLAWTATASHAAAQQHVLASPHRAGGVAGD